MSDKLQKVLAQAGLGSRREMERWIEQGRVKVNRHKATVGQRVTSEDILEVDGKVIEFPHANTGVPMVLLYNKPLGQVTTRNDPEGRPTVFEGLPNPPSGRWISVGRLDVNTSGLLLFTTDGELANRLMHPSFEIEREYAVRVLGNISPEGLAAFKKGFVSIKKQSWQGANQWYRVILKEGKYRMVRRLFEEVGCTVSRLIRVRYGPIELPKELPMGGIVELPLKEVKRLLNA